MSTESMQQQMLLLRLVQGMDDHQREELHHGSQVRPPVAVVASNINDHCGTQRSAILDRKDIISHMESPKAIVQSKLEAFDQRVPDLTADVVLDAIVAAAKAAGPADSGLILQLIQLLVAAVPFQNGATQSPMGSSDLAALQAAVDSITKHQQTDKVLAPPVRVGSESFFPLGGRKGLACLQTKRIRKPGPKSGKSKFDDQIKVSLQQTGRACDGIDGECHIYSGHDGSFGPLVLECDSPVGVLTPGSDVPKSSYTSGCRGHSSSSCLGDQDWQSLHESEVFQRIPILRFIEENYKGPDLPAHSSSALAFGSSSESESDERSQRKRKKERRVNITAPDALWHPHFHPHNQEFRVRYRYKGSMRLKTLSCSRFGREGAKRLTSAFVTRWQLTGRRIADRTVRSKLALTDLPEDAEQLPVYGKKRSCAVAGLSSGTRSTVKSSPQGRVHYRHHCQDDPDLIFNDKSEPVLNDKGDSGQWLFNLSVGSRGLNGLSLDSCLFPGDTGGFSSGSEQPHLQLEEKILSSYGQSLLNPCRHEDYGGSNLNSGTVSTNTPCSISTSISSASPVNSARASMERSALWSAVNLTRDADNHNEKRGGVESHHCSLSVSGGLDGIPLKRQRAQGHAVSAENSLLEGLAEGFHSSDSPRTLINMVDDNVSDTSGQKDDVDKGVAVDDVQNYPSKIRAGSFLNAEDFDEAPTNHSYFFPNVPTLTPTASGAKRSELDVVAVGKSDALDLDRMKCTSVGLTKGYMKGARNQIYKTSGEDTSAIYCSSAGEYDVKPEGEVGELLKTLVDGSHPEKTQPGYQKSHKSGSQDVLDAELLKLLARATGGADGSKLTSDPEVLELLRVVCKQVDRENHCKLEEHSQTKERNLKRNINTPLSGNDSNLTSNMGSDILAQYIFNCDDNAVVDKTSVVDTEQSTAGYLTFGGL